MSPPLTNHSNLLPIFLNIHPLAEVQDSKGTPFEDFPRVFSTNRKPAFRALDQWEASISARFWTSAKLWTIQCIANRIFLNFRSNGVCFYCQWNANWLPIECQLIPNGISIDFKQNTNWLPILCQFIANWLTIEGQLTFNWRVILWDPVSIVQNSSQDWLLGCLPL